MAVKFRDYYDILSINRDAGDKEIHKAFRKLARKYHPDLNPGDPRAEEKFKEVNEAYEVLRDPEKRKRYDTLGENWKAGQDFTPPPGWEEVHFDFGDMGNAREDFFGGLGGGGFSDFFNAIFGNRGGFGTGAATEPRTWSMRGQDVEAEMTITLEDAFRGTVKSISLRSQEVCSSCGGRGISGNLTCAACQGKGVASSVRAYEVRIPPGITDGGRIRLAGQGGAGSGGGPAGDLFIRVHIAPHPMFRLNGHDISATLRVAPWEAALGAKIEVPTLEGNSTLTIPPGTQSGQRLRMRGMGLPKKKGERGDQYVEVRIVVPRQLTPRERELFVELSRISRFNPRKN
ncbi:MAG: J domain-containing protein [Deltaproteobacteria bacterium]|nr:J domain-containing protein [Deltaproteobacteria bacterium]